MGRQERIARSIVQAIANGNGVEKRTRNPILAFFSTFFSLYQLLLRKIRPADFASLRRGQWEVTDDAYLDSFQPEGAKQEQSLTAIGGMGFSGSVGPSTPSCLNWHSLT